MLNHSPPSPSVRRLKLFEQAIPGNFDHPRASTPWRVGEEPHRWDVSFSGLLIEQVRRGLGRLLKRSPRTVMPVMRSTPIAVLTPHRTTQRRAA